MIRFWNDWYCSGTLTQLNWLNVFCFHCLRTYLKFRIQQWLRILSTTCQSNKYCAGAPYCLSRISIPIPINIIGRRHCCYIPIFFRNHYQPDSCSQRDGPVQDIPSSRYNTVQSNPCSPWCGFCEIVSPRITADQYMVNTAEWRCLFSLLSVLVLGKQ